jgi:acyl carrier protein
LILELCKQLLARTDIAASDDFFESGGDSLLASILSARLSHRLGIELSPILAFEAPTLRRMASRIDELRRSASYALIGHLSKSPEL